MESVSKLSFGINETLRIIVPGYYLFAVLSVYIHIICPSLFAEGVPSSFVTIVAGLVLGFILYSLNYPNNRYHYKDGLPSAYLQKRSELLAVLEGIPALVGHEPKQLYFYILNNFMPQTFHEVIMVKGALYYCITYMRLISAVFAAIGVLTFIFAYICHCLGGQWTWTVSGFQVFSQNGWGGWGVLLYAAVQLAIVRCLSHHPPNGENRADAILHEIYKDQIKWLEMNTLLVDYLIRRRKDPRVYTYFSDSPGGPP